MMVVMVAVVMDCRPACNKEKKIINLILENFEFIMAAVHKKSKIYSCKRHTFLPYSITQKPWNLYAYVMGQAVCVKANCNL